jgi:hypothetical protein
VSARPAHADLYRRYFSGTVSFGTEVSALVIPESWLDHPSPFADPALHTNQRWQAFPKFEASS